jgi:hypothetical protein
MLYSATLLCCFCSNGSILASWVQFVASPSGVRPQYGTIMTPITTRPNPAHPIGLRSLGQAFRGALRCRRQLARPPHMADLPALGAHRATARAVVYVLGEEPRGAIAAK